jgi:hypothetical protein
MKTNLDFVEVYIFRSGKTLVLAGKFSSFIKNTRQSALGIVVPNTLVKSQQGVQQKLKRLIAMGNAEVTQ